MNARRAVYAVPISIALVLSFSAAARAAMPAGTFGGPQPVAASESPLITTVGTATIPPQNTDFVSGPQMLMISATSKAATADAQAAVSEMQQRLLNIKAALQSVGVPASGIRFQYLNVNPTFGPPQAGQPSPVEKGQPLPQQVTTYMISGSLQADIPDVTTLIPAMNAATTNGATQVNVGGKGGPPTFVQPPSDLVQKAANDAVANARATADAIAQASGKKLGAVHSVSVNQLTPYCCPPSGGGWQMQVSVSFEIAP